MRKFSTTLFLLFALCATVNTFAQTALDPWAALKAKDFATAFAGLQPLAEKGDAKAQERLGWMFRNGEGTPKDVAQSLAWFRKAADQGNAPSQTELGWIYREGRGIEKDDAQAVSWFRKGAEQNHSGAQYAMGYSYASGRGVPKDEKEALAWYEKAAQQGHAKAKDAMDGLLAMNKPSLPNMQPKFDVGDKWTFRKHDKGNNKDPYVYFDQVFKVVAHSGYLYRKTENPAEQRVSETVWRYDYKSADLKEWFLFNPKSIAPGRQIWDLRPDDDNIQMPLSVGKKYSITRPIRGRGAHIKYDVEVVAFEKIKVEAGEFDAYRINLNGWWTMTEVNPQLTGHTNEVMYYAPAAKRVVKHEHYSRNSNGGPGDNIQEELIKWEPKAALVTALVRATAPEQAASAPQ